MKKTGLKDKLAILGWLFCACQFSQAEVTTSYFEYAGVQWLVSVDIMDGAHVVLEEGQLLTQDGTSDYDMELDVGELLNSIVPPWSCAMGTKSFYDSFGTVTVQFGDECFRESTFLHSLRIKKGSLGDNWAEIVV